MSLKSTERTEKVVALAKGLNRVFHDQMVDGYSQEEALLAAGIFYAMEMRMMDISTDEFLDTAMMCFKIADAMCTDPDRTYGPLPGDIQ